MMDTNTLETKSIIAVKDSILQTGYIDSGYISERDKQPSWDGSLYIYKDFKRNKNNLIGRLPVQVKGHESDDLSKSEISYSVNISDLKNFLNDGGAIYFVVYIKEDLSSKIYYTTLPPAKLQYILTIAKEQATKSIKFKEFPTEN